MGSCYTGYFGDCNPVISCWQAHEKALPALCLPLYRTVCVSDALHMARGGNGKSAQLLSLPSSFGTSSRNRGVRTHWPNPSATPQSTGNQRIFSSRLHPTPNRRRFSWSDFAPCNLCGWPSPSQCHCCNHDYLFSACRSPSSAAPEATDRL